ncbi:hypothetical protein F5Y17DRAFT_448202 [Xylariaceae sp. FL0594]|nr:hypothetical protein F5Y17DRAFT_448202 [Xylariaceae sp. FL0594]
MPPNFSWSEFGSSQLPAPAPATPDRSFKKGSNVFSVSGNHPSTTPGGPPPSSSASFTPVGEPSPSLLQSSIASFNKPKPPSFGKPGIRSSTKSSKGSNIPLGRSMRSSVRRPSALSREYHREDDEEDEGPDEDHEEDDDTGYSLPPSRPGTHSMDVEEASEGEDEDIEIDHGDAVDEEFYTEEEGEEEEEDDDEQGDEEDEDEDLEEEEEEEYEDQEEDQPHEDDDTGRQYNDDELEAIMEEVVEYDVEENILKDVAQSGSFRDPRDQMDDEDDLLMLATPAADNRIQRVAEDIFRVTLMRTSSGGTREVRYATLAKDLCTHLGYAALSEPDSVLLKTEDIVNKLYDEGVGPKDDAEKLDSTLSQASSRLMNEVWMPHAESLPAPSDEHSAKVGPSPFAPAFEKALYLANLVLRIHHAPAFEDRFGMSHSPSLPQVLFSWQEDEHNLDGDQIKIILQHRPAPAAHTLFWDCVFNCLVRGNIRGTIELLRNAGWESVKKTPGDEAAYVGQALANINRVVGDLCQVLEHCPAVADKSWDIRSSDWTLFRLRAQSAKEALIKFAEASARSYVDANRFSKSEAVNSPSGKSSLAGLARKAESQIPWDIYENLQSLYAIVIGEPEATLAAAQDWCEATIGLFGWWDDGHNKRGHGLSHSRSAHSARAAQGDRELLDRLALCLQTATQTDFHFNSADPVEVSVACALEGNVEAVIGFLRLWSLPIATAVAEIASLGRWLPPPEPQNLISMNELDADDLALLGVAQDADQEDADGIKDATLIHYARTLRKRKEISGTTPRGRVTREGWEMAVQVVGRMDSHERSEQMVQELLHDVLDTVDEHSRTTVDKMWRLLNDLGMINFAEDTAETFGDILAKDTFRFGESLWYYALAHRPGKVRDVLNTLMSISLVESTVYPADGDLDEVLRALLKERTTTLEGYAKQDLEAANLLGKMLSGYATLRQYYEYRDGDGKSQQKSLVRRQQAAAALAAVIASADDNIRGGLYDDSRDAVVSEDFLLALLGEMSVFIGQSPPAVTLDQINTVLKAIEDIQTVGSRVYDVADEFFKLVMAAGHGKGSTPASLLDQSVPSLGGSFVMTGSSMIASKLHKSVVKSAKANNNNTSTKRGWDWRTSVYAGTTAASVLKQLRLGITKDLANLWLEEADNVIL